MSYRDLDALVEHVRRRMIDAGGRVMSRLDLDALVEDPELANVMANVATERARQKKKWGQQDHDDGKWALILMEEVGEAAQASLEATPLNLRAELVQTAAVVVAWVEALDRRAMIEEGS